MRLKLLTFLTIALWMPAAIAAEAMFSAIPNASVVGRGVLTYAFWDVYEATLYAPKGKWNPAKPFALSITYYHTIKGSDIADRSIQEMCQQGFADDVKLAAWHAQMKKIFPDVNNGFVLSALYHPKGKTVFYDGKKVIGTIKDKEFGKAFFGIWLDEKTSEPSLRRALLGLS